jgi:hypothetical protein
LVVAGEEEIGDFGVTTMSRLSGDQIIVKPTNNIYTVLVVVGIIAQIIALVSLWLQHTALFGKPLFQT